MVVIKKVTGTITTPMYSILLQKIIVSESVFINSNTTANIHIALPIKSTAPVLRFSVGLYFNKKKAAITEIIPPESSGMIYGVYWYEAIILLPNLYSLKYPIKLAIIFNAGLSAQV
jgi:hypothetical protein